METKTIETKEEKLKKLFLLFLQKIKRSLGLQVEYRVHGGNQADEIMTEFRTNKEKTVDSLIEEFLKNEFKEKLTKIELTRFKSFVEKELEQYLSQIEQEAYAQLRKYINYRYYETTGNKRTVVPESVAGNDIFLLTADRPTFEKYIKLNFLEATGPGRSNVYGLTAENLPRIDKVIQEEVDKLVVARG